MEINQEDLTRVLDKFTSGVRALVAEADPHAAVELCEGIQRLHREVRSELADLLFFTDPYLRRQARDVFYCSPKSATKLIRSLREGRELPDYWRDEDSTSPDDWDEDSTSPDTEKVGKIARYRLPGSRDL
jgi:hypothetical protein